MVFSSQVDALWWSVPCSPGYSCTLLPAYLLALGGCILGGNDTIASNLDMLLQSLVASDDTSSGYG